MKINISKIIAVVIVLSVAVAFVIKFGGPSILRSYIEAGTGTCATVPMLCMQPRGETIDFNLNKEFAAGLIPHKFPKMAIFIPKGFSIVQQTIKRPYYKKRPEKNQSIIYVLHEERNFFITLYPQLQRHGVTDDYEFMRRLMYARLDTVQNFTDAFFIIMKGIFTPNLGDQNEIKMTRFTIPGKEGFINYNLTGPNHYFDCIIFNDKAGFFKLYIQDVGGSLDLKKVFTIISTIEEVN